MVVRFIADASARAIALETGEILLAPDTPVPLGQFETLKADPNLVLRRAIRCRLGPSGTP